MREKKALIIEDEEQFWNELRIAMCKSLNCDWVKDAAIMRRVQEVFLLMADHIGSDELLYKLTRTEYPEEARPVKVHGYYDLTEERARARIEAYWESQGFERIICTP